MQAEFLENPFPPNSFGGLGQKKPQISERRLHREEEKRRRISLRSTSEDEEEEEERR